MKRTFLKTVSRIVLGAAIASAPFAFATQSLAQDTVTRESADDVVNGTQSIDLNSPEGGASSFFELMQQIGRGQNWGDFLDGQPEDVNNAISDFRAKQLEIMNGQTEAPVDEQVEGEEFQSANPLPVYRALW